MKRIFFLLIAANGALSAFAQSSNSTPADSSKHHHRRWYKSDSMMKRWVFDLNVLGGVLTRDMNVANTGGNYTNGIAGNDLGDLTFKNGTSYGADAQIGYFFGSKGHFGIGLVCLIFISRAIWFLKISMCSISLPQTVVTCSAR